jgi:hypothetical protein
MSKSYAVFTVGEATNSHEESPNFILSENEQTKSKVPTLRRHQRVILIVLPDCTRHNFSFLFFISCPAAIGLIGVVP